MCSEFFQSVNDNIIKTSTAILLIPSLLALSIVVSMSQVRFIMGALVFLPMITVHPYVQVIQSGRRQMRVCYRTSQLYAIFGCDALINKYV